MSRLLFAIAMAAVGSGCQYVLGIEPVGSGERNCNDFDPAHVDPCAGEASGPLVIPAGFHVYDTTDERFVTDGAPPAPAARVQAQDGVEVLVWDVDALVVEPDAILRVGGGRPLIVVATDDIAVDGLIDVSSDRLDSRTIVLGAGANTGECTPPEQGESDEGGGGGSGGGGYRGPGGSGGPGDLNDGPNSSDGQSVGGGGGAAVERPAFVRGGCPGAAGGRSSGSSGASGEGGGAIELVALGAIAIAGAIDAGGSGGGGGRERSGGGGGGSGGYIGLDAPAVVFDGGILAANGGGGGEGGVADRSATESGRDGERGAQRAAGGERFIEGGDGAPGSAGDDLAGADATDLQNGGGGGGGGGAGWIVIRTGDLSMAGDPSLSPPATNVDP